MPYITINNIAISKKLRMAMGNVVLALAPWSVQIIIVMLSMEPSRVQL